MKKRYLFSSIGAVSAIGASVAGYYLKEKGNREKLKENFQSLKNKVLNKQDQYSTFDNAGVPDEAPSMDQAQLENSKMVSEGSQFGVQYYNEKKEED
ncbi:hypothetical protein CUC15_08540 [Oceanobacillus zhaokaii]|jgi:hypothetical protein|uniref:Uncharacterized protein n=1 Tax=Oceanobacillus zhaokaii TaxID=2052660 RepID=A0A345PG31_9BACI|nr:hypothetical protein [Oceanobacillus zhaokaii]AXI08961.1 hypothetical protein CUC15_08540 [Oceanobacillus zhaokaii]